MSKTTSLALSRTPGESVRIGPDIEVLVVDVHPGAKVRLRIRAPENVAIHRSELRPSHHPKELQQMVLPQDTKELIASLWAARDDTSPWRAEKDMEPETIDAAGEEGQARIQDHLVEWIGARAAVSGTGGVAGGNFLYTVSGTYRGETVAATHRLMLHALASVAKAIIEIDVRMKAPKGAPATWLPGDLPAKEAA